VGPDLASYATKPFEAFLIAVLDPSAAIDPRHAATTVELKDGREWTGVITEAAVGQIVLLMPGGHSEKVPRDSIRTRTPWTRSLMPEGLTEGWTPQSMADLWEWIRHE
jgi:putative heme-binding domain-containing protein